MTAAALAPDLTDWARALRDPSVRITEVNAIGRRALGIPSTTGGGVNTATYSVKHGHDAAPTRPAAAAPSPSHSP